MISNQIAPIKRRLLLIATLAPNSMLCTCSATVRLSIHNTPLRTIPRTAVLKTFVGGAGLGFAAGGPGDVWNIKVGTPGFVASVVASVAVTLLTPGPSPRVAALFDEVNSAKPAGRPEGTAPVSEASGG